MHALVRRQSWIAAALLARVNRCHALPRGARVAAVPVLVAVLAVVAWVLLAASQHRLGMLPASLRWWLPAGLGAWTAVWSRRRMHAALASHRRGWMQAWPLPPRALMLQQAALAAAPVLAVAAWPAVLCGLLMAGGAANPIAWNLAGCCLGVLVGAGLGRWPAAGQESAPAAAPLLSRTRPAEPFAGLAQLLEWQRRAIGRLSLRRWVLWTAPLLLMAPSRMGVQAGVQLLLLVLAWPLYARAMAGSLETISAASRLLAATPLNTGALCRPLLRRPMLLALALAAVAAIDLAWLTSSSAAAAAAFAAVLLFEGGRIAYRCRQARNTLAACVKVPGNQMQEKA